MLHAAKDRITSAVAQKFINARFARYATVNALRVDSRRNRGEIEATLAGESRPVRVVVERYALRQEDGKSFVRLEVVTCDRPWLEHLIHDLAGQRWIEVPGWAAAGL